MTPQQLAALGEITRKAIADAVEPLVARIKELEALREQIPAAYDDAEMKSAFSEQGKRVAAVIDGVQAIKDRVDEVAKSVPSAYDDTALRGEMDVLLKGVDVQLDCIRKSLPQDGKPGQDGTDGRDALQLEVLPAIDEQKSYTRGTYAKHAGGLWRAFEKTSAMRGWECIVEGVKELQVDMVDKRLSVKAVMSSGALTEMVKELPIQIYRGVFKSDDPYHQGDTATWAGSLWHCNVTGTKALPGDGSADWTLAVKKGRDGREVVSLPRKQKPVQIGDQNA